MKGLFGLALWQMAGFVESLLHLVGLNRTVPDFSTLSPRQTTLAVNIPYHGRPKGPQSLSGSAQHGHQIRGRRRVARPAAPNGGSGERYTSASSRKRWISELSFAPQAICRANLPSIRLGQVAFSAHFRWSRSRAFARINSFRMTAVITTFFSFPMATS